jgi:uncharacterized peroxidase-related enzyme
MRDKDDVIAEIESRTGPSNFFRAMSHHPEAARDVALLHAAVMGPGAVSERLKDLVCLAVSVVNECDYCSAHHEARAKKAGVTDAEIEDVRTETDYQFDEKERVALRYARELTRTSAAENETRDAFDSMFGAEEKVELTLAVGLANFTNRFSNGLRIPLEKEKYRTA